MNKSKLSIVCTWLLYAWSIVATYGFYCTYSTGYDHGRSDGVRDATKIAHQEGFDIGLRQGEQNAKDQAGALADQRANQKLQEYQAKIEVHVKYLQQQAYQAGAAAYAKAILDSKLQFQRGK